MIDQLKQVGMTYITWRWMWFVISLTLLFTLPAILSENIFPLGLPLGIPCMMGLIWFAAVVKWQFVNPRARLLPGYARVHLLAFGTILLLMLVVNPLMLSVLYGINPLGPLAFTLSLGGCMLVALLLDRGVFILPTLVIFFSGFAESTQGFWFGGLATYGAVHFVIVLVCGGMVGYCLWYLAQLTEEMDEYQVVPLGGMNLSRLERAEQRRLVGRQVKKQKLLGWFNDRWLDRGIALKHAHTNSLVEYGIARNSGYLMACLASLAYTLYGLALMQFDFIRHGSSDVIQHHPPKILVLFAILIPAGSVGMLLMQHRPRMSQELLRPAGRTRYIDSLLTSLVKRSVLLWVGLLAGLWVIGFATDTLPKENVVSLSLKFLALSFAVQIPAFGICLRLGLWKSIFGYAFGMYAAVGLQMGAISLWWHYGQEWGWVVFGLFLIGHVVVGAGVIFWARRKWLEAEHG